MHDLDFPRLVRQIALCALLMVAGCGKGEISVTGRYHIDQDGYGFGPGADKITLDLRGDKTFDVNAGPVNMLNGAWEHKAGQVIFSREQGSLVNTYRIEEGKLIPMKDGKEVPGWRWKR
jgi:hypothetical protein